MGYQVPDPKSNMLLWLEIQGEVKQIELKELHDYHDLFRIFFTSPHTQKVPLFNWLAFNPDQIGLPFLEGAASFGAVGQDANG